MKILITGGSGFIGSHCADALIDRGDMVTIFDHKPPLHESRSTYSAGDLRDRAAVEAAIRGHDFVIHLAGVLGTIINEAASVNILGGLNVLDAVQRHGNNLIILSKPNVWLNSYSITKDCVEKFGFMSVNEFDVKLAIIKAFNIYGPRQAHAPVQKAIPSWILSALRNEPLAVFGRGTSTMDLIHVRDATDALIGVLDHFDACRIRKVTRPAHDVWGNFPGYQEQVLELGSGREITVADAVDAVWKVMGLPPMVTHLPMRPGEVEDTRLCADIARLSRFTGFRPSVSLEVGLRNTVAYYKERLSREPR